MGFQDPVVQTLDSAIHRIKIYPMDSAISLILIGWIVIYPVDNAIQRLNNRVLETHDQISSGKIKT